MVRVTDLKCVDRNQTKPLWISIVGQCMSDSGCFSYENLYIIFSVDLIRRVFDDNLGIIFHISP